MEHRIKIKKIEHINHNVLHLVTDKPKGYIFKPGQATEVSIDKENWSGKKRPFTFTSLPEHKDLEFTIKVYPSHHGVTEQLEQLQVGDHLLIGDAWGAINYIGPGTFIAGGAGITPFIAIFKDLLQKDALEGNSLFFGNQKEKDIIYKNRLEAWLGDALHIALSEEQHEDYHKGFIDKAFLERNKVEVSEPVYLCGPPAMMEALQTDLHEMGMPKSVLVTEDLQ